MQSIALQSLLARQANALTGGKSPIILKTLAAAFAEARSNTKLAGQLQAHLKLYQAGLPLRQ
jgi:hypothetical protein